MIQSIIQQIPMGMRIRAFGMLLPALLCVAIASGCGDKKETKLPPEMPKGGLKNVPTNRITTPKPLPPPK